MPIINSHNDHTHTDVLSYSGPASYELLGSVPVAISASGLAISVYTLSLCMAIGHYRRLGSWHIISNK